MDEVRELTDQELETIVNEEMARARREKVVRNVLWTLIFIMVAFLGIIGVQRGVEMKKLEKKNVELQQKLDNLQQESSSPSMQNQ